MPVLIHVPPVYVDLRIDRAKLKVVVKNLVGNALKFTERGAVTVRASREGERVVIEVADSGVGIAPNDLPVIFQAFRQVKANTARSQGGVGLGLFIVARFVQLLRGAVSVQSTVGAGSTFRIELPVDYGEAPPLDVPVPGL